MATPDQFLLLFKKWQQGKLTAPETDQLLQLWESGQFRDLTEELIEGDLIADRWNGSVAISGREKVLEQLREQYANVEKQPVTIAHRVHFLRTAWFRVAVAILLITGIGTYLWNQFPNPPKSNPLITQNREIPVIAPGGNKAVLTLADGSTIVLDSAATGKLADQSGATIQKSADGEIIYAFDESSASTSVVYNTMSTPRGGQYQLILPDGSKVWLNAESSITFPTAFTGNTREVKMTGEVYFEIKANPSKPFIVKTLSDEIQVLGTSFNVNAYNDAPVKTSLLEGSIKINTSIIKPGQAYMQQKVINTNPQQDIAWKNGVFDFNQKGIMEMARQLARWYDVEVVFDGPLTDAKLYGKADRNVSLNGLLKGLEGEIAHFELKGRTLHISAASN